MTLVDELYVLVGCTTYLKARATNKPGTKVQVCAPVESRSKALW